MPGENELESAVRSLFEVRDTFVTEDGAREFKVAYKPDSRDAFIRLLERLRPTGHSARLYGSVDDATLLTLKEVHAPQAYPRAPIFLFFLTLLSVVVTGYVLGSIYPVVSPGANPVEMGLGFVAALLAILFARDLTQRYVGKAGRFTSLPYYLPNLPLFIALPVMYFLPTFGSITFPRSPATNKNSLFDFYFFASVVGVVVTVAVALLGAGTSVVLTKEQFSAFAANQTATIATNPSLLQNAVLEFSAGVGLSHRVPEGGTMIFSPLEIAAWLGLLLCFFNLLPAALFDGGRMAHLVLGERGSKVTTGVTALLLLLTDLPNYWVVFLLVFLLAAIQISGDTLDSISGLSKSRRVLFAAAVVLALLCVPVPQNFATLPLPSG